MLNHKQFTELLEGYIAGNITAGQYHTLMQLVKTGDYDAVLKQHIDDQFLNDGPAANMDGHRSVEILNSILNSEEHTAGLIPVALPVKKYYRHFAAAATVLVMLLGGWWLVFSKANHQPALAKTTSKILQPVVDTRGKKYIRLQDGSTVLLNEGSRLDYPDEFKGKLREVNLTGEAYFDIKHDADRPFIVHTGKVNTIVLGTAFNIKAYPTQKEITVTVTRGRVKVGNGQETFGIISPNESIAVNTTVNTFKQEKVNAEKVVEWKKEYLVMDDLSFEEAASLVSDRYHVNILFSKEGLKQCRISATFLNNESLEQVLTVITGVVSAGYSLQPNDQVIITGKGCQ